MDPSTVGGGLIIIIIIIPIIKVSPSEKHASNRQEAYSGLAHDLFLIVFTD